MRRIARFPQHGGQLINVGNSGQIPVNTSLPTLMGIGQVGKQLTWSDGGWDNTPTNFTYQLNRNGTPIAGATTEPYTQTAADIGQQLTVSVTAINAFGPATATNIIPAFGIYQSTLTGVTDTFILSGTTQEINHAHISPDGAFIAFVKYYRVNSGVNAIESVTGQLTDYDDTEILLYEVATGNVTIIVPHNSISNNSNPVWWPDMSKISFVTDNTANGKTGIGVYTFSPGLPSTAGTKTVLYNPVDAISGPYVNSDGTAIVFTKNTVVGGVSRSFLYIYNVSNAVVTQLTNPTLPNTTGVTPGDYDAHWSPDRTKIATSRLVSQGIFKIVVITVGTAPTYTNLGEIVIDPPGSPTAFTGVPEWSSNGAKLVTWLTDPEDRAANGLWTVNPDGTGWTKIPTPPQFYHNTVAFTPGSTTALIYSKQGYVVFPALPVNTVPPTISGTVQENQTLTVNPGTWINGTSSGFNYQWKRAGADISGANASTYTLVTADVGSTIRVAVVGKNTGGSSTPPTLSAATSVVIAAGGTPGAFPGQTGNLVGYTAAPGYPGSLTTMSITGPFTNGTVGSPTVYSFKDFDAGTSGIYLDSSRQNIKFVGCRFQSNNLGYANVILDGAVGITFDFCTVCPRIALVTAPPNAAWPSAGAGLGLIPDTEHPAYQIVYTQCYQYGFNLSTSGAGGPYTITNCDIWGGQNLITTYGTTQLIKIDNNWIHDFADQHLDNATPRVAEYHQDGVGYLNAGVGPSNIQITNNTIAGIANTNIIAFQGGNPSANNMTISGNFISGGTSTIFLSGVINTAFINNTIGSDFPYQYQLLYTDYTATFSANGNSWSGNKFRILAGTVPYPGSVPQWTTAQDGFFVLPNRTLSATDFGGSPADSLRLGLNLTVNSIPVAA